jgi:hypothetical protein
LREQPGLAAELLDNQALMGLMRASGRTIDGHDGNSDERAR